MFLTIWPKNVLWRFACTYSLRIGDATADLIKEGANMKNTTNNMIIVAAALLAVASAASAQTMEAKIPFAFRAGGKVLAAGTYRVKMQAQASGTPFLTISSYESRQTVLALGFGNGDAKANWKATGDGILSFECGNSRCALRQVWMGPGASQVYRFATPNLGADEPRHVAEINMRSLKTE
jgi:hypothetical protein